MKRIILLSIGFICLLSSCSVEKRRYMKGFYIGKNASVKTNSKKEKQQEEITFPNSVIAPPEKKESKNLLALTSGGNLSQIQKIQLLKIKYQTIRYVPVADPCDTILLRNGTRILGKITEINPEEIKTQACDGGPPIIRTISKSEVLRIKFANGTTEEFIPDKKILTPEVKRKLNGFSLAGFILSLVSYFSIIIVAIAIIITWIDLLFLIPAFLALLAFIFSVTGVLKITNNKNKYKGLVFSIIGIVLSIPLIIFIPGAFLVIPYALRQIFPVILLIGLLGLSLIMIVINKFTRPKNQKKQKE